MPRLVASNVPHSELDEIRASPACISRIVDCAEVGEEFVRLESFTEVSSFANLKGVLRIRNVPRKGNDSVRRAQRGRSPSSDHFSERKGNIQTDEFGHFRSQSGVSILQLLLGGGTSNHENMSKIVTLQDRNAAKLDKWE